MKLHKIILGLLASTMVAGCTVNQRAAGDIRMNGAAASEGLAKAAQPLEAADKSAIRSHSDQFVGNRSVRNEHGEPLPARLKRVTLVVKQPASLKEIAMRFTKQTGLPALIAVPPVTPVGSAAPAQAAPAAPQSPPEFASGPIPANFPMQQAMREISSGQPGPNGNGQSTGVITATPEFTNGAMTLDFDGNASDLLDMVATNFDVSWKYERGRVLFESTITRNFDVPALPMVTSLGFSLGAQGDTAGGAQAKTDVSVNVFEELVAALDKLIGTANYAVNRSTGVVTVTGTPASVDRVAGYLDNLNSRLQDQVALSVKVYAVTVKDDEDFALNVGGVFKGTNALNLTGAGTAAAVSGGGSLGWALVDAASQYNGSNAAVKALSQRGDVSVVTTASLTTVNGQPVPLQVGQDRDYIKEITVEKDTDAGTESTTFNTDKVSTGFALQLMPRIQRNGDVLLQYGINIKELVGADDGFDSRTVGGNTVQLQRLNQRNFIQNASIPAGKTLVLAGFEQVKSSAQNSGIGHPLFSLLGGSSTSSKEREVIVIMITPTVLK
jgi:type IVB pilus formation R64 PilN family outer membrane protein